MRVFSTKQSEIVWDGEHNQALCSFSQGVFETDDKELVKKLVALGYQCDCEIELEDETQDDEVIPEDEVIQENEVIPEDTTQKKSTTKKNVKKGTSNDEE